MDKPHFFSTSLEDGASAGNEGGEIKQHSFICIEDMKWIWIDLPLFIGLARFGRFF
jgi:hypothetical protein